MSLEGSHNDANDNTRLYGVIKNTPKNSFYLEKVYDYFDDEEPRQTARGVELLLIAAGIKANGPKPKAGDWAISFRHRGLRPLSLRIKVDTVTFYWSGAPVGGSFRVRERVHERNELLLSLYRKIRRAEDIAHRFRMARRNQAASDQLSSGLDAVSLTNVDHEMGEEG